MFFRAKLASFYGWTHHYINELEWDTALEYYEAITVIECQENLVDMNITDYPRMKSDGRKDFYRKMRKLAYPQSLQKEISFEEFAKKLGMTDGRRNNRNSS